MDSHDCLFCRIRDGGIPARPVFKDDLCFVLQDINPQAPTHLLIIPNTHVASVNDVQDGALVGHLVMVAAKLAKERGVAESGYRLVFNTNEAAGQSVFHLHLHLLGGRNMGWPPG